VILYLLHVASLVDLFFNRTLFPRKLDEISI
jgi:hypothetical protein